jgi:hypothetical protein
MPIGQVESANKTGFINNYKFSYPAPAVSTVYYRIRQKDVDGRSSYSQKIRIDALKKEMENLALHPNPVVTTTTLTSYSLTQEEKLLIIYDMQGKGVKKIKLNFNKGFNSHLIDLTNLSAGSYLMSLESALQKSSPLKIIKQ